MKRVTRKPRNRLFGDAVKEYVTRRTPEETTDAMDRVCAKLKLQRDEFTEVAARRILTGVEW
jgi:hypothetical protein